jgi:hypothetical protein
MRVSIKTPALDLEIDDAKSLDEVLKFVAELKKIETTPSGKKRPPKKK